MPRRVDQIELVELAILGGVLQAHRVRLDGDSALALQIHGIEDLSLISRAVSDPVSSSRRSASVDLP